MPRLVAYWIVTVLDAAVALGAPKSEANAQGRLEEKLWAQ